MEDKKVALALFISIVIILVWNQVIIGPDYYPVEVPVQKTEESVAAGTQTPFASTTIAPAPQASGLQQPAATTTAPVAALPTEQALAASPTITIENQNALVTISSLGARITSYKLRNYRAERGQPELLDLISNNDSNYPLGVRVGAVTDALVSYQLEGATLAPIATGTYQVSGQNSLRLNYVGTLPNGIKIHKAVTFNGSNYFLQVQVKLEQASPDLSPLWLEWREHVNPNSKEIRYNAKVFELLTADESIERIDTAKAASAPSNHPVKWIGFGNNYFLAAILPSSTGINAALAGDTATNNYNFSVKGSEQGGEFNLFVGPKITRELELGGYQLKRSIDLGWFAFIGQPILWLISVLYTLLGNYGLAIILLTLIIRLALLPLTKSGFESMKKMQEIAPEMQELRKRIKDPNELNREVMELYKKRGVNPMGGCFPILLQIPVFLGMYNALRVSVELRHAPFALWINDLSAPEHLDILGIPVPVMIILMGISMLWAQVTTPSTMDPAQKKAMLMVPLVFTVMFIIYPFPSGLVLYWLVSNIISIIQQTALRSEKGINPFFATVVGSVAIFGLGFLITLF